MNIDLDVAIIGASSSGLYAAEQLARSGRSVGVFDQQVSLTPARRTLIVTPQMAEVLGYFPTQATLHRVEVMALAAPGATASIALRNPDLIVERSALVHLLVDQARRAGAELHLGYRFQGLDQRQHGAAVHFRVADDGEATVIARAIIGADGPFSDVARAVGLSRPPVVPILQAEVLLPSDWDPAVTQVWFDTDDTRFFYWLIPESADRGVIGLVGDDRAETRSLLQRFLDRRGIEPLVYQGAQVALHHPRLRPWGRIGSVPVMLVGDAAGQVKNTTVGGTVTGLWGAAAAVRALVQGTSYARELRSLKRELDLHWLIRVLLDRLSNPGYDSLLHTVTPTVETFLSIHNRDQMAGVFCRLLLRQPRLLAFGLRLLLRPPGRHHRRQTPRLRGGRSEVE